MEEGKYLSWRQVNPGNNVFSDLSADEIEKELVLCTNWGIMIFDKSGKSRLASPRFVARILAEAMILRMEEAMSKGELASIVSAEAPDGYSWATPWPLRQ